MAKVLGLLDPLDSIIHKKISEWLVEQFWC